jgi:predicted dehydrogenase
MIRVGIIGCGKIADAHAEQIQYIPGCRIVGACDEELLMAEQFCDRFDVEHSFGDVRDMLDACRLDAVHITTPPQSHFDLGRLCLESGSNVYVEKPFTVDADEAEALLKGAKQRGLKVTVGHDHQFSQVAMTMRKLVAEGYLGGPALHMESLYNYDLGDPVYTRALLGDKSHWVRKLPGKLLHNVISHGISKIAEFLSCDTPRVVAQGFTSRFLRNLGETDLIDELRVALLDDMHATAYFTFSTQMRPGLHQFRLYGPKNGLVVDYGQQTVLKLRGNKYKSHLERLIPPFEVAGCYIGSGVTNVSRFLRNDFQMNWGMKKLIASFYRSIAEDGPPPIPYREILLTTRIMDDIFSQLNEKAAKR